MNTITRRQALRQRIAVMTMVLVAVFGYFVFDMTSTTSSAQAAPATTQGAVYCHPVTIPKTLPWWQCQQNIFGTVGSGNLPYGCYTHTVRVCD